MKAINFIDTLKKETSNSDIYHKHACVAIMNGRRISPYFHNYKRSYMFNYNVGSAHAEMCVINYLLNQIKCKKYKYCIL